MTRGGRLSLEFVLALAAAISLSANVVQYMNNKALEQQINVTFEERYQQGLGDGYMRTQCCNPQGEGCDEPIYGSDC